jgi:hypothetical protein
MSQVHQTYVTPLNPQYYPDAKNRFKIKPVSHFIKVNGLFTDFSDFIKIGINPFIELSRARQWRLANQLWSGRPWIFGKTAKCQFPLFFEI